MLVRPRVARMRRVEAPPRQDLAEDLAEGKAQKDQDLELAQQSAHETPPSAAPKRKKRAPARRGEAKTSGENVEEWARLDVERRALEAEQKRAADDRLRQFREELSA